MKVIAAVLAVLVIILGIGFASYRTKTEQRLESTRHELKSKDVELAAARTEVTAARSEVAEVKAEMKKNFVTLEEKVEALVRDKVTSEEKMAALSDDMKAVLGDLQQEKDSRRQVEQKNLELASSLESVNTEVTMLRKDNLQLQQSFSTLENTYDKTLEQFTAMREDYVTLTKERDDLNAVLHDLDALKAQIRTVKIELHEKHVEDWKRRDRADSAGGNAGFLLKGGEWKTTTPESESETASKFSITEDIRREQ